MSSFLKTDFLKFSIYFSHIFGILDILVDLGYTNINYLRTYCYLAQNFVFPAFNLNLWLPNVVRQNPTTLQTSGPMSQPCWTAAMVSAGIPIRTTNNSQRIRFIRSRLNSVLSWKWRISWNPSKFLVQWQIRCKKCMWKKYTCITVFFQQI